MAGKTVRWHKSARFDVFVECDVYVESDGHYLYVENRAWNYDGDYTCREYHQVQSLNGTMHYERLCNVCAANGYIVRLEKAPMDVAKEIVLQELKALQDAEMAYEDAEDDSLGGVFEDVRERLIEWDGMGIFRA